MASEGQDLQSRVLSSLGICIFNGQSRLTAIRALSGIMAAPSGELLLLDSGAVLLAMGPVPRPWPPAAGRLYLHFHHMDGVPAALDLLRSISSLLYEDHSSKAVIQVPEVDRGDTAFKIPARDSRVP